MNVEVVILIEEIFYVFGREVKVHAAEMWINGFVGRVKEVEDLI